MQYPSHSEEYRTIRLAWPSWLPRKCPHCGSQIIFKFANNGKKIRGLYEFVYQIINFYICSNIACPMHNRPFNPAPRFDYGERYYGMDVFREIAEDFLLYKTSINSIYLKLVNKFQLEISERTVARICDDILNLKAYSIDQNTKAMIQNDPMVILGIDGQDPGKAGKALWVFMDHLKNRILYTCIVESVNYEWLHQRIEMIKSEYQLHLLGFVSDKQNTIVKCCDTYYPTIPHQYCQYHFLRNTWNHLETLDSNLFLPLKKVISKLYIHTSNATVEINFEGFGKKSVSEVFNPIDADLQRMSKVRNKTFKQLRGVTLYTQLMNYVQRMKEQEKIMNKSLRITKIFHRVNEVLSQELETLSPLYYDILALQPLFTEIYSIFNDLTSSEIEQQVQLDEIYAKIWINAQRRGLEKNVAELKSFLPNKSTLVFELEGEWCRLWESYRRGLFHYHSFPKPIKTNNGCEQAFSQQKQAIFHRSSKKEVGHMIETRGEAYLRITHCSYEELQSDLIQEYSILLMQALREQQQEKITTCTGLWRTISENYFGYQKLLLMCFPEEEIEEYKKGQKC